MKVSRNLLSIILIILLVISFTVMALAQGTEVASTGPGNRVAAQSSPSPLVSVKFLTQNTQLLPGPISVIAKVLEFYFLHNLSQKLIDQCVDKHQRVPCILDLIRSYDIVGLQEVWDEYFQRILINSWPDRKPVIISLPKSGSILDLKHEVTNTNFMKGSTITGRIIDARPNRIKAYIVYDRYFVMGPDSDLTENLPRLNMFNVERQDGGLLILTKKEYPIIAASGFVFKDWAKFDNGKSLDAFSNKGVLYARIQVGPSEGDYIHVFNTHLQAHGFPAVRKRQLRELAAFILNATIDEWAFAAGEPVLKPSGTSFAGSYDGHPIVLMGDFNIIADRPESKIPEYKDLLELLPYLEDASGKKIQLVDVWDKVNPTSVGYTWIGKDQKTDSNSPWWILGNVLAGEGGGGQRIDYFFYTAGTSKLGINPASVSLVPPGPQKAYCFDKKPKSWRLCTKFTIPKSKDDIKKGGVYWLRIDSTKLGPLGKVYGIAYLDTFKINIDPASWAQPKFDVGDIVLAKILTITNGDEAAANGYTAPGMTDRCTLISHTVSDHLGVEMLYNVESYAVVAWCGQSVCHLSDIQESSVQVGWGSFHKDFFSKRGETRAFILDKKTYQKGLDTHAPAKIIYNLNKQFKKFQSFIGLWDSGNPDRGVPGDPAETRGSVSFIVALDGKRVYDSGVMGWNTPAKSIDIDVSGAQILELRVMDDGNLAYDWSIWADAKLLK